MLGVRAALAGSIMALALLAIGHGFGDSTPGVAQSMPGAREWAEAIVELTTPRWEGPTVPRPPETARPPAAAVVSSLLLPLSVHFGPSTSLERAERVLAAVERAHEALSGAGWPAPPPDGGRGETDGFDLYISPTSSTTDAFADASLPQALLDAVSTFAVLEPDLPEASVEVCTARAYAEAALLAMDPAEARSVRRATAEWLAWTVTGVPGCSNAISEQQRHPHRGFLGPDGGEGGALFLALLSARHDGGSGVRIREAWQFARQASGATPRLRASPDFWMALEHALRFENRKLVDDVTWIAAERYHLGRHRPEGAARAPLLREVSDEARVSPFARFALSQLPRRTRSFEPALEPFGSAYVEVDVRGAAPGAPLKVWLRGEYGVRWSLQALVLDGAGNEHRRLEAPSREAPRSYLPIELTPEAATVVLVVTNLSSRRPDADRPDENERSFELIVDR